MAKLHQPIRNETMTSTQAMTLCQVHAPTNTLVTTYNTTDPELANRKLAAWTSDDHICHVLSPATVELARQIAERDRQQYEIHLIDEDGIERDGRILAWGATPAEAITSNQPEILCLWQEATEDDDPDDHKDYMANNYRIVIQDAWTRQRTHHQPDERTHHIFIIKIEHEDDAEYRFWAELTVIRNRRPSA